MTLPRNLLGRLLVPILLWIVSAATASALNYDFENVPSIGATSVTIGGQTWTLTGTMIGEPRHELGAPAVGAATPESDGYIDSGGTVAQPLGNVGGIKAPTGVTFRALSFDIWPSNDAGNTVYGGATSSAGTVGLSYQVIGKKNGSQVVSANVTDSLRSPPDADPANVGGFWHHLDLSATSFATTDIDTVEFVLVAQPVPPGIAGKPINYIAIDNFTYTLSSTPTSMTANAGTTPQSATINAAFTNAPAVTVKDASNNPVSGVNVTFTAPGSGASGTFSNSTATITVATNASGVASAPFTANATAGGPYTVTAAASGLTTVNFSLTNTVGAATQMTANAGTTPQSATISTAFTNALAVTVKDVGNNPVSGVNVTFTAPGSGASGTFSNSTATITVATNAAGVASAPFTANSTAGGPYTVTAAASGLTTVNFSLTNAAGAAASMTANAGTTPQSATISTAFTNALAVTVKDAGNNPVSGVNVTFTSPGAGASGKFSNNTATITVATNAAGVASAPFTANSTAGGPYTVTAAASGLTTVNFSLTNAAGAAASMTANAGTTPQSATINTAFTNALAVTVKDAGSNPVSGVNVTFTAPGSGASGKFSNNTATITITTNAAGVASAPFTANSTAGGPYTVTAAASGLTTVNFSLTNATGAAASMTANAGTTPQSATISTAFTNALAVTVKDAGSNPVSGVNVTFTAPGSGASGTFSNSTATITVATNAAGVASAPFTANSTAGGPYTVTAAASGLTTVNFSLTNTPGAATQMTANAGTTPQSATISTAFTNAPAVTIKDASNNPVSGVNVTFTAPGSGASGLFSNSTATITVATNASGVAAAPFTANTTAGGPYTLTAAASGLTTVNFSLTNTPGAATQMTANAGTTPQSAAVNTAFTNALAVTIKDAANNPVSGVNVAFTAPGSGASGLFSNSTATITVATNASGMATAPFTANGTGGGPYTVTAAASGLTTVNFSLTNTTTPILSITKSQVGTFTQGNAAEWDIVIHNTATSANSTNGSTVTVEDTMPAGYTIQSVVSGNEWNATATTSTKLTAITTNVLAGGASYSTIKVFVTVPANSPTSVTNTGLVYGGGDPVHTNVATAASGSNTVTVVQAPTTMTANAGTTPQSTTVNTAFANPLAVTVKDAANSPVSGVNVTFTAPSSGASGTFSNNTATITIATNASGVASAPFTANGTVGGPYTVTAAASGLTTVSFTLTVGTINPTSVQSAPNGTLNRQTGLFQLPVTVTNTTLAAINGFRLHVDYSAYLAQYPSLRLFNASSPVGSSDVYVDYPYPVAVNASVPISLDFYVSDRRFPSPFSPVLSVTTLTAQEAAALAAPQLGKTGVPITNVKKLPDGTVLLEWNSVAGHWYRVSFCSDMQSWVDSTTPLQAGGSKMQWIDSGPPFTDKSPADPSVISRFYIVNEIATP